MSTLQTAVLAVALAIAAQAQGSVVFDFSYSDPSGNIGSGQLTANPNGNGSYTAVSGSFNWTAGAYIGSYALLPNPDAPGVTTAHGHHYPDGTDLIYDNQLFPGSNPSLNGNGLVFEGVSSGQGYAINLWGNWANNYELFVVGSDHPQYGPAYGGGSFTLTAVAVPEPTTMLAGAGALLLALLGVGLHSKQSRVSRTVK
jgi:hypothetical protein